MNKFLLYRYQDHVMEEFVMDEAFQQWVRHPDATSNQFWQQFLHTFPDKRGQVEEASEIVRSIHYSNQTLSKKQQAAILQKVYIGVDAAAVDTAAVDTAAVDTAAVDTAPLASRKTPFLFHKRYIAIAATISLLLISMVGFWLYFPAYETYETGYQENKTIQLADGSEVSLNANTKIKVSIDVDENKAREVWLEGEAYFHVKRMDGQTGEKLPELKNFIVHTDNFDIEVLGTVFNVSNRSKKSEVLLKSGKVKVASQQIEQTQILQPGDLLTLSEIDERFHLKKTETATKLAWRDNFFVFDNAPLSQVARAIEDYYGLEVKIADKRLADKIFTARISRQELPLLLKAIEASFGVKVLNDKGTINIQP